MLFFRNESFAQTYNEQNFEETRCLSATGSPTTNIFLSLVHTTRYFKLKFLTYKISQVTRISFHLFCRDFLEYFFPPLSFLLLSLHCRRGASGKMHCTFPTQFCSRAVCPAVVSSGWKHVATQVWKYVQHVLPFSLQRRLLPVRVRWRCPLCQRLSLE